MGALSEQLAGVKDLPRQFEGFQKLLQTALDKLDGMESWKTIAEISMGKMMDSSKQATQRLQQLEGRPLPSAGETPGAAPLHQTPPLGLQQLSPPTNPQQPPPLPRPPPVVVTSPPAPGVVTMHTYQGGWDLNTTPASGSSSPSPSGHGVPQDHRVVCGGPPSAQP
jgi:hypothetical protein